MRVPLDRVDELGAACAALDKGRPGLAKPIEHRGSESGPGVRFPPSRIRRSTATPVAGPVVRLAPVPTLLLVRHAQGSFGSADYDVLSERGHEQAHVLAAELDRRR